MSLVLFSSLPSISGGQPDVFSTMLTQCELNELTSLDLSVTIFPLFSIAMVLFARKPLLVRKGLTVFQNDLLLTKAFTCYFTEVCFFLLT